MEEIIIERLNNMEKNIDDSFERGDKRMSMIEKNQREMKEVLDLIPSSSTVKWFAAMIVTYTIASGNYLVGSIHNIDTDIKTHVVADDLSLTRTKARLTKIEKHIHKD